MGAEALMSFLETIQGHACAPAADEATALTTTVYTTPTYG